ncbi:methyltransferase [Spirulina sp. 06S082]|uniref:methyltransferase n=1 Tax=Spirulina sp. 06S082 TaxID=3110248 RepID=UPI002B201ACA|nr:methyltransferase [Spirulina sp. 06S082]MEA5472086.1 methyltransferase [Spirulina sp. 06S082]
MQNFPENQKPAPETYQTLKKLWKNHDDIFKKTFQSKKPYGEPMGKKQLEDCVDSLEPLIDAGLIIDYQDFINVESTCQINVIDRTSYTDPIFICTDFPEHNKQRVFPYCDEAEQWLKLYHQFIRTTDEPEIIVDLCCGAGSIGLCLAKLYPRSTVIGFDNNPRALKYAEYNATLNHINTLNQRQKRFRVLQWDAIRDINDYDRGDDTRREWESWQGQVDLVCADPPFSMNPPEISFEHSHGGEDGSRISHKNMENAAYLLKERGVFLMLSYSLGDKEKPIKLLETFADYFPENNYEIVSKLQSIPDALVWRVNGEKSFKAPMDVQYMIARYNDEPFYTRFQKKGKTLKDYQQWIDTTMIDKGLTHLHYIWLAVRKK